MTDWTIVVVDTRRIKGKPPNWMPSAAKLIAVGVPPRIARRWERDRYDMTAGLRRRVRQSTN